MGRKRSQKRSQGEFKKAAEEMHERLWSRRKESGPFRSGAKVPSQLGIEITLRAPFWSTDIVR